MKHHKGGAIIFWYVFRYYLSNTYTKVFVCIRKSTYMFSKKLINIPNLLSGYRLFMFPVILYFALTGRENLFVTFLVINLVTDILDGFIARTFHLQTEFGARLDSIADVGSYILAFLGVFLFKLEEFRPHFLSFSVFLGLYISLHLLSLIKFRRFSSLHLYSSKIGGYLQGFFFFVLFVYDFYEPLYYVMICWGIMSQLEHISIQLMIPELRSNLKGLYWVLKERS